MNWLAIVIGLGQGAMATIWLNSIDISIIGSINIGVAVGYTWYKIICGSR